jgi:hypothetical protein
MEVFRPDSDNTARGAKAQAKKQLSREGPARLHNLLLFHYLKKLAEGIN